MLTPDQFQQFINHWPWWLSFGWQGDKGVDLFFVVSGFLIGRQLYQTGTRHQTARTFYRARILRIMPVYFLALFLWALRNPSELLPNILSNLLFLEHVIPGAKEVVPGGWSLGVEMYFYLLAPLVAATLLANPKTALRFLLAGIAVSIAARYGFLLLRPTNYQTPLWNLYFHTPLANAFDAEFYLLLPFRATPLLFGLALAWVARDEFNNWRRRWFHTPRSVLITFTGVFLLSLPLWVPVQNPEAAYHQHFSPTTNLLWLGGHRPVFALGMSLIMAVALFTPGSLIGRVLALRCWRPISQLVLPMYLFHFPMVLLAAYAVLGGISKNQPIHNSQVVAIWLLGSLFAAIFALIVHLAIERPIMNMRR